ncbi:MAG TPA: CBS domain-containing protein [Actinomycetospora sp.]|jgi:hypothetical protein|uniref:CBS domain-containing protein n=1 Tax=Actinomycetospora sp. TaxID=1872135 RepID=UPI002F412CA3
MTAALQTEGVGRMARDAVVIDEGVPLGAAWHRLHEDPDRCGVVVRGRMPIAVVTAGDLAERWPGGGPACSWARPVGAVLERPLGVEVLDADDDLEHAARRLLSSGLIALPVAPVQAGGPWLVLGLRALLAAVLDARSRP